jgi:hypothetical protein
LRNRALNEVRLFLVDDAILDERRGNQHFHSRHATGAGGVWNQTLGNGGLEHGRQLQANLFLLMRREDRNDAVDGFRRVQRVQRGEDKMAGFGGVKRRFNRLLVAHFTDQDDIRILTQRAAQRQRKASSIDADLALVDD